jgi:DNA-binding NarL/FixJ family response regulator
MTDQLLTNRELEVLGLMAKGYSNLQIGNALFISQATVLTHICRLYQKLEISEYDGHGGSAYRVRAVLKFFELQKKGVI